MLNSLTDAIIGLMTFNNLFIKMYLNDISISNHGIRIKIRCFIVILEQYFDIQKQRPEGHVKGHRVYVRMHTCVCVSRSTDGNGRPLFHLWCFCTGNILFCLRAHVNYLFPPHTFYNLT